MGVVEKPDGRPNMINRKGAYVVYIPVIGLLVILAFVPNLDHFINDNVFVWGLPVLGASAALVGTLVDFQGRARLMLLLAVVMVSMFSLFLVSQYPSTVIIGFASGLPPLLLVVALYGPKDWRRSRN